MATRLLGDARWRCLTRQIVVIELSIARDLLLRVPLFHRLRARKGAGNMGGANPSSAISDNGRESVENRTGKRRAGVRVYASVFKWLRKRSAREIQRGGTEGDAYAELQREERSAPGQCSSFSGKLIFDRRGVRKRDVG